VPEASPAPELAAIELGQRLFEERRLSGSGQIACASCHDAELGFTDGLRTSFGHDRQRGRRNARALFTARWTQEFFWDGRERTLEGQVLGRLIHTRPYMHKGVFPFLEPVVMFCAGGGGTNADEQVPDESAPPPLPDPLLKPRNLTQEKREALVAFLQVL